MTTNNYQPTAQNEQSASGVDENSKNTGARPTPEPVIAIRDLKKTYLLGQTRVRALRGVTLVVNPG